MCPGFLWFFSNDGWPENILCNVTVSSTLLTTRCSGKMYRGLLEHDLTKSRQCKGLYFDAVSALNRPLARGGRAVRAHCWGRKSIDEILEEA